MDEDAALLLAVQQLKLEYPDLVLTGENPILNDHSIHTSLQFFNLKLHCANLNLSDWLKFENFFKFCIEFVKLSACILQKQFIKVLLADEFITFLKHLAFILLDLLKYVQICLINIK